SSRLRRLWRASTSMRWCRRIKEMIVVSDLPNPANRQCPRMTKWRAGCAIPSIAGSCELTGAAFARLLAPRWAGGHAQLGFHRNGSPRPGFISRRLAARPVAASSLLRDLVGGIVQLSGGAMGIEDGAHCWLCGRPLEQADRVTRVPNLSLFVHT